MYKKIDKLLESFENTTPPTLEQTRNKILKVFLKEYEKRKPDRDVFRSTDIRDRIRNQTLSEVDEVIYKMLKIK